MEPKGVVIYFGQLTIFLCHNEKKVGDYSTNLFPEQSVVKFNIKVLENVPYYNNKGKLLQ